jgi:hypothetical protein
LLLLIYANDFQNWQDQRRTCRRDGRYHARALLSSLSQSLASRIFIGVAIILIFQNRFFPEKKPEKVTPQPENEEGQ